MNCPICKEQKLVVSERNGIEIDYCPNCRGVWLDRGELDKIIEKIERSNPQGVERSDSQRFDRRDDDDDDDRNRGFPRRRREGFLGDLFDF